MEKWELVIVNETKDGYLCMSPNGDTNWMTKKEYINYLKNRECTETQILKEKSQLTTKTQ